MADLYQTFQAHLAEAANVADRLLMTDGALSIRDPDQAKWEYNRALIALHSAEQLLEPTKGMDRREQVRDGI